LVFNTVLGATEPVPSGIVLMSIILEMIALTAGNTFLMILLLLSALILIVLNIVLYFKALLIYIKMILSVVTAPLELVLGTVPGSEARIQDWFKRMAKYGITIFAMGLVIPITLLLAFGVVVAYVYGDSVEMGGWGTVMSVMGPMVIVIMGFSIGLGMEKRVESMFFGGKPKK
jgi:hypothetical protein